MNETKFTPDAYRDGDGTFDDALRAMHLELIFWDVGDCPLCEQQGAPLYYLRNYRGEFAGAPPVCRDCHVRILDQAIDRVYSRDDGY